MRSTRNVTCYAVPCPGLAAIIQAGEQFDQRAVQTVREACEPLREADVDTVILAARTPADPPDASRMLGPQVELISSGAALARQVEHALSTRRWPARGEGRFLRPAFEQLGNALSQMPRRGRGVELAAVGCA